MSECLGLYVQNNLIKYAKVSKEKNNIKIESYGVKFFDNLEKVIEQIIRETYSYKTSISVNITNEKYMTTNLFNLLNKKDLNKAISTEFDYFCNEKIKNRNALEYRYITMPNLEDKDKVKVLYCYTEKANIVERLQNLNEYKVSTITPVSMAISNLANDKNTKDALIINLEGKTTVTILSNGKPYNIEVLDEGIEKIINAIAEKENSYSKAYEICKNTTIYTRAGQNLQLDGNDYLDEIMPTLFNITEKVKDIIKRNQTNINNIYITGTGAIINNIDLYFQENFMDKKCEILIPFFVEKANLKLNIKDYVEVNSAIAVALEDLKTQEETSVNFIKKNVLSEKIKEILLMDIGKGNKTPKKQKRFSLKEKMNYNMKEELDWIETWLIRGIATILIAIIVYIGTTIFLKSTINARTKEIENVIKDTENKIANIEKYTETVNQKTNQYNTILSKIEEKMTTQEEKRRRQNAIPNMLNQIMFAVPEEVQILSIENTSDKIIKIKAEAKEYQQLGYFKAAIQNDAILLNVTSTSGTYSNGLITVEISGELPY